MAKDNERAFLKCVLLSETAATRTVQAKVIDGQEFTIEAPYWSVEPIPDNPMNEAWLEVKLLGELKIDQKCSILLPAPSLQFGDRINVNSQQLKKPA